MRDKITKLKLKNSEKIANAFLENNGKFILTSELYKKQRYLAGEKHKIIVDIIKIYFLAFKGLSSRRKSVATINGRLYSVSRRGVVRKVGKYGSNYDDITFKLPDIDINQELMTIGENAKSFKKVLKKEKKDIFEGFFKNYPLLRNEDKIIIKFEPKQVIEVKGGFYKDDPLQKIEIDEIALEKNGRARMGEEEYDLNFYNKKQIIITINFSKMFYTSGVVEKIYIEQMFTYIRELFEREIKNREKEIKRLRLFHSKIKTKFGDYLMLEVIEKDNT